MKHLKKIPLCPKKIRVTLFLLLLSCLIIGCVHWKNQNVENQINHHTQEIADLADSIDLITRTGAPRLITQNGTTYNPNNLPDNVTINQDGVVLDWNNPCDNCYRMSWGEVIYDPWKNMTTSEILNSLITIEGEEVVISSEKPRLTIPLNENVYSDAFKNAYRMYPEIPSGILEAIVFSETQFRNLHSELDSYPESLATDGDHGTPGYTARYTIFNLAKDDYMIGHEGLRYLSSLSGYDVEELIANPNKVILAYAQGLILSASNRNMSLSSFDDLSYLITDIATGGRYPLSTLITMPYNMRKVAIALQYEPVRQFYGLERIQFELDDFTLNTFPKKLDSWGYLRYANPLTSTFLDAESRLYVVNDYRISNGLSAITLEQMLEIEAENKWSPPPGVRLKQLNTTSDGSGGNQTFSVNNSKCEKAYDTNDPRPMYPQPTFLGPPLPPAVFGVNECYWPDVAASAGVIPNWTSAVLPSGHGVCNNLCGASSLGNEHEQKVIAIHGMQGSMSGSLTSNVKNCSAAAHYYISQNGIIIQAIHENRKGAHAGVANPNNIGIEHEKSNPQFEKPCLQKNSLDQCIQWGSCIEYDDKSYSDMDSTIYRASARLVVSIASRHPDIDVSDIFLGNPEYTSSIPPGCFGGSLWPSTLAQDQCVDIKGHHHFGISKTCPGANWDWYTYFNHLAAVQQVGHSGPTQPYTANSGSFNLNSVGSNYWAVHTIDNNQMFGELDLFNASFEKNDQIWLWGNPYKKGNPIYVGHRPVGSYVNSTWYAQDQAMFSNLYSVWGGFSVEVRTDCNAPAASFGVTWASGNVVNTLVDDPVDFGGNNSWNSAKSLDAGRTTSPNGNNLNLSQYNTVGSGDPDRNKNWKYDRPRGYGLHERHFGYAFGGDSMITRTIAGDLSSASDQNWYVVEFPNGSVNGIELTEDTIQFRLLKAAGTGDPVKLTVYKNTSTTNMAPLTTQPVAELFSGEAFMRKISKADNILRLYLKVEAGPDYASNGQFVFGAGWMYPNNDLDGYVLKCYDAFEGLSGNNNAANAHPFPTLTNNTFQSVTIDGCLDYVASDEDWYYVPIANAGMLTASLFGQENDFNIELVNAAGLVTSSSINGSTIGEYLTYCGSGGLSCEGVFVRIWPQSSSFPSGGKGYTLVLFWDGSVTCSPSGNIGTSNNQIFSSSFVPINVSANTTTSCPGGQVTLTATGGSTYDWYDDQGSTICTNCPGIQTVTIPTGVSAVTYTVSESGSLCAPESITINVTGGPTALAGADQTSPSSGSTVSLNGNASGGTPGYSYQWTWNGGNVSGQNVSVSPLLTTQYTLTVTDANGCQGADDVKIEVPVPTTTC
ncbi:MAG: N-acetylmuramoyl-L-alanine amidase, partial [Bacteroidota bacterium]